MQLTESMPSEWDRLPPHSIDAEMQVIGSLLISGDSSLNAEIIAGLPVESFYQADHEAMYRVISGLFNAGRPIDSVVVHDELKAQGILDEVGGRDYLHKIIDRTMIAAHGIEHAKTVLGKWKLREAIKVCSDVVRQCYGPQKGDVAAEILTTASNRLLATAATGRADSIVTMKQAVDGLLETLHGGKSLFLPTGLQSLDDEIFGLLVGGYTLIGADSRTGKSLVARDILMRLGQRGIASGLIALEETPGKIAANSLAHESLVESRRIMGGRMDASEWQAVEEWAPSVAALPILIETVASSIDQIEGAIAILAVKHHCQCIVIDHFHLIDVGDKGNETSAQSNISGRLKRAFQRHNVAGVVLDQVTKGSDLSERPTERSLRGTNRKFNDCDLCILLYREDFYRMQEHANSGSSLPFTPSNKIELIIPKNKSGTVTMVPYGIDTAHQKLYELSGPSPF
jgi:replicative DNA helicase